MVQCPSTPRRPAGRPAIYFWIAIAALVAGLFTFQQWRGSDLKDQGSNGPGVGRPLSMLRLEGLADAQGPIELADLRGKVVLVNFWGVWCPPCRIELPHIAGLHKQFSGRRDFQLLAVSCDHPNDPKTLPELKADTAGFLAERGLTMPTYADPDGTTRSGVAMAMGQTQLPGYPTTVLLDREGVIRGAWVGYQSGYEMDMQRLVEQTLGDGK